LTATAQRRKSSTAGRTRSGSRITAWRCHDDLENRDRCRVRADRGGADRHGIEERGFGKPDLGARAAGLLVPIRNQSCHLQMT
jgi:hypothetical protein